MLAEGATQMCKGHESECEEALTFHPALLHRLELVVTKIQCISIERCLQPLTYNILSVVRFPGTSYLGFQTLL